MADLLDGYFQIEMKQEDGAPSLDDAKVILLPETSSEFCDYSEWSVVYRIFDEKSFRTLGFLFRDDSFTKKTAKNYVERWNGYPSSPISKTAIPVLKVLDREEGIFGGVAYRPGVIDAHGQWMSEETCKEAQRSFMKAIQDGKAFFDIEHEVEREDDESLKRDVTLLECYTARVHDPVNGILKGDWVVLCQADDEEVLDKAESGGFSIQGEAVES